VSGASWGPPRRRKPKARVCTRCSHDLPDYFLNSHTCDFGALDMTTGEIDSFLGATEIPRDRWGRPLILTPEGKRKAYTRCTTFVGCLEDTYNLSKWQQRMVALGLAQRDDLLLSVSAHTDDKRELDKICEAAMEAAAASSGATKGTALHKLCERLDRGDKVDLPTAAKADVAAYQRATQGVRWTHIEAMTVHDALEVAGTPDRIGIPAGGGRALVWDIKTGSIEYGMGKIAMQLAMYARSAHYDPELGTRTALDVDLERAVVIHLPAGEGTCSLVEVDIAAGWEAVQHAAWVRDWRKRKNLARPFGEPAPASEVDQLAALIRACTTRDELLELRNQMGPARWNAQHDALAKAHLASVAA
jgi:hypothetical protein